MEIRAPEVRSDPLCRKFVGTISIPTVSPRMIPADSLVKTLHSDREYSGICGFERKILGRVRKWMVRKWMVLP
jgi:hypothetical protein